MMRYKFTLHYITAGKRGTKLQDWKTRKKACIESLAKWCTSQFTCSTVF